MAPPVNSDSDSDWREHATGLKGSDDQINPKSPQPSFGPNQIAVPRPMPSSPTGTMVALTAAANPAPPSPPKHVAVDISAAGTAKPEHVAADPAPPSPPEHVAIGIPAAGTPKPEHVAVDVPAGAKKPSRAVALVRAAVKVLWIAHMYVAAPALVVAALVLGPSPFVQLMVFFACILTTALLVVRDAEHREAQQQQQTTTEVSNDNHHGRSSSRPVKSGHAVKSCRVRADMA